MAARKASKNAAGKPAAKRSSKPRSSKSKSIEERAKRTGASGKRLSPARALIRNELIVQRRLVDGWSWPKIATEAGVSARQCERIFEDAEKEPSGLLDQRPTEVIEEWLRGYRRSIEQFVAIAAEADNSSSAVGALKAANDARDKIIVLLQAVGHTPNDLGRIKIARDLETIARSMFAAVEAFRRDELTAEEVADAFYEAAGLDKPSIEPPAELAAGDG
jgi:hypothetical protein